MFEFVGVILQAWREIAHIAEWTGLSIGTLVALGFLAYLDPDLRKLAIRGALLAGAAYCLGIFAYHVGSADKQAEWNAANVQAAQNARSRDAAADKATEAVYGPIIAARDQMIAELNSKVRDYETKLSHGSDKCPLGTEPLRLRNGANK